MTEPPHELAAKLRAAIGDTRREPGRSVPSRVTAIYQPACELCGGDLDDDDIPVLVVGGTLRPICERCDALEGDDD